MKVLPRIVLALAAAGCCISATAQTSGSDADRRARNREEALANYHRMQGDTSGTTSNRMRDGTMRSDGTMRDGSMRSDGTTRTRGEMHSGTERAKDKVKEGARSTQNFTHRQLNKVRNFGDRQGAKLGANPGTRESDKAPTALGK